MSIVNNKKKKVLYIAYQFPPNGGGGVQRALRHANAMANAGYIVDVITVNGYIVEEKSLVEKIHPSINIIRQNDILLSNSPFFKNKFLNKLLSFLLFPDRNILWAIAAYYKVRSFEYDIVFSTSHPYSAHIISLLLKLKFPKVQMIVDYRDAWSNNPSLKFTKKYPLFHFLSSPLEKYVNSKADKIITVSEKLVKYINHHGEIHVVYNAYDEDDFEDLIPLKKVNKFILFYMGSLYAERNLQSFFKAFNIFLGNLTQSERELINFRIVGINDLERIKTEISKEVIDQKDITVEVINYLSHDRIILEGLSANLLLLLIGNVDGADSVVTGKLLEYIKFNAPILAIVPRNGEAAEIIRNTKTGMAFGEKETESIVNYLTDIFENWKIDYLQNDFTRDRVESTIRNYSKLSQNKILLEIISR